MARDQGTGGLEWANVRTSASGATTDAVTVAPEQASAPSRFVIGKPRRDTGAPQTQPAPFAVAPLPDQLMRDIAEIERTRDALATGAMVRRMRAFMVVPSRSTADSVPLLIGGVMALVMLSVFVAAAAMTKFGR
jgi:hypothetical protein